MVPEIETPLEPTAFGDGIVGRMTQLYGGEAMDYTPLADTPALRAVAIRADDFREDRGNWPKVFHYGRRTQRAVVLVHGLTDSPGYVEAIGLRLATHGDGSSVVLPLLPGHGRKQPGEAMESSDYRDWRATVDASVELAATLGEEVSIGGFSTGGALAVDKAVRDSNRIPGQVFLFSAALDLSDIKQLFIGTHVANWIEAIKEGKTDNNGIGGDPCKYSRMFMRGAEELEKLIREMRRNADADKGFANFRHKERVFVAHSEADEVIEVAAVLPLVKLEDPNQHHLVPKNLGVRHSSLVLERDKTYEKIYPDEREPPKANPEFPAMIAKLLAMI